MILVPYKVRGTIRSYMWGTIRCLFHIRYGDHKRHWQLQGSCIPYKVWGIISHWQLQSSHIPYNIWETIRVIVSYKVLAFHIRYRGIIRVIDSYKVPTFHVRYGGTIRVMGSYKVHAVDSNHTCGGMACPSSRGLGASIISMISWNLSAGLLSKRDGLWLGQWGSICGLAGWLICPLDSACAYLRFAGCIHRWLSLCNDGYDMKKVPCWAASCMWYFTAIFY